MFGARELLPAQRDLLEKALGAAHRVLNEKIEFARQMVEELHANSRIYEMRYWQRVGDEAEKQVEAIRCVLSHGTTKADKVTADTDE